MNCWVSEEQACFDHVSFFFKGVRVFSSSSSQKLFSYVKNTTSCSALSRLTQSQRNHTLFTMILLGKESDLLDSSRKQVRENTVNCINWDHSSDLSRITKAAHEDEILSLANKHRIKASNQDGKTGSNFQRLKDKWRWREDWVNKGALEESLISAGMLAGKVSPVHAFPAGVGLPLPGQLSSALQIPNQMEGAFTLPAPCILPAQRQLPFPRQFMQRFHRANVTQERGSTSPFSPSWAAQGSLEGSVKLFLAL